MDQELKQEFGKINQQFEGINEQFRKIDQRFEGIDRQFEKMDQRFEGIDRRFEKMDQRFDRLETSVTQVRLDMETGFSTQRAETQSIKEKLTQVDEKVERLFHTETEDVEALMLDMEKVKRHLAIAK